MQGAYPGVQVDPWHFFLALQPAPGEQAVVAQLADQDGEQHQDDLCVSRVQRTRLEPSRPIDTLSGGEKMRVGLVKKLTGGRQPNIDFVWIQKQNPISLCEKWGFFYHHMLFLASRLKQLYLYGLFFYRFKLYFEIIIKNDTQALR